MKTRHVHNVLTYQIQINLKCNATLPTFAKYVLYVRLLSIAGVKKEKKKINVCILFKVLPAEE